MTPWPSWWLSTAFQELWAELGWESRGEGPSDSTCVLAPAIPGAQGAPGGGRSAPPGGQVGRPLLMCRSCWAAGDGSGLQWLVRQAAGPPPLVFQG